MVNQKVTVISRLIDMFQIIRCVSPTKATFRQNKPGKYSGSFLSSFMMSHVDENGGRFSFTLRRISGPGKLVKVLFVASRILKISRSA